MFDFNSVNAESDEYKDDGFSPIPAGYYKAIITESELKPTKGGGEYLKLRVEIIDGDYKGRVVFGNLNLVNANPTAEKIAKAALGNICRAVGVMHPRAPSELHNKPLMVKLSVKPETPEYPAGNDIKAWEPVNGAAPAPAQAAVATDPNRKPWEK